MDFQSKDENGLKEILSKYNLMEFALLTFEIKQIQICPDYTIISYSPYACLHTEISSQTALSEGSPGPTKPKITN